MTLSAFLSVLCQLSTVTFAMWCLCTGPCPQIRTEAKPQFRGQFPKAIQEKRSKLNSVLQRLGLSPAEMVLGIQVSQHMLSMQVTRSISDSQFVEITSPIDADNRAWASSVSISFLFLCLYVLWPILLGASLYGGSRTLSSNTNSASPMLREMRFHSNNFTSPFVLWVLASLGVRPLEITTFHHMNIYSPKQHITKGSVAGHGEFVVTDNI